jgi:magnesium transporter
VVDEHGRFQGLIPPHRLADILLREHDEDLDRLGGFLASTADTRTASEETVGRRLWHRMPWLAVGLVGAMASAGLLAGIEDQIASNLAVAYFIPAIVYLADAVGTQTETLAIRGLSVGVGIGRIARREALTGLLVGCLLAAAMLPLISWLHDPALALAVSVSVLAASTIATLVAMALPWLLNRLGRDPAFGSGPRHTGRGGGDVQIWRARRTHGSPEDPHLYPRANHRAGVKCSLGVRSRLPPNRVWR